MGASALQPELTIAVALLSVGTLGNAVADPPKFGLGTALTKDAAAPFDIEIRPDGTGLPAGSGTVKAGETLFAQSCAACHGAKGEHPISSSIRLTGGMGTLATPAAVQTVGSYWPYATTLYDYIHRAMPFNAPQSLSPDQVYAVTAYVLYLNGIVPETQVLDAASLPQVQMPNRNGFVTADPAK
ncbi:MAG: c-type cytochrome [Janthinobacterium lividum]